MYRGQHGRNARRSWRPPTVPDRPREPLRWRTFRSGSNTCTMMHGRRGDAGAGDGRGAGRRPRRARGRRAVVRRAGPGDRSAAGGLQSRWRGRPCLRQGGGRRVLVGRAGHRRPAARRGRAAHRLPAGDARRARGTHRDHADPWPAGPTAAWNLQRLSARCHRAKHAGWRVDRHRDGSVTWHSPLGRTYRRPSPHAPPPQVDLHAELPPRRPRAAVVRRPLVLTAPAPPPSPPSEHPVLPDDPPF